MGVTSVKSLILRIRSVAGAVPAIPEDLPHIIKKAVNVAHPPCSIMYSKKAQTTHSYTSVIISYWLSSWRLGLAQKTAPPRSLT